MAVVETQRQGEIVVIRMDNPPVNALGHALRLGLEKAFGEANADDRSDSSYNDCLGECLAHQLPPTGAECGSHGQLAFT